MTDHNADAMVQLDSLPTKRSYSSTAVLLRPDTEPTRHPRRSPLLRRQLVDRDTEAR